MNPPVTAVVALGSNLDDPESHVRRAFADLARLPETWVAARSALYRTAPVGHAEQPPFVQEASYLVRHLGQPWVAAFTTLWRVPAGMTTASPA